MVGADIEIEADNEDDAKEKALRYFLDNIDELKHQLNAEYPTLCDD